MYVDGLYDNSLVIASNNISHSYSNPIWNSDWNIKDLYLGSGTTDFVRRFSKDHMYREISKRDIQNAIVYIEQLGNAIRKSDVEAKNETQEVLEFIQQYINDDNVIIIMEDET